MKGQLVLLGKADSAPSSAAFGRKASTLHVLSAQGLPVPAALALSFSCAADIERGHEPAIESLRNAASSLRFPLAVRSSANLEDLENGAAPGLFHSVLGVQSTEDMLAAIADVLDSGRTPLVQAYLQARGIEEVPRVAIIVQEQVALRTAGVLYSRPPGQPESSLAIVEIAGWHPIWIDRETGDAQLPDQSPLLPSQVRELWALACACEQILHSPGGLDVEWVWDDEALWIVQARAVVHRQELTQINSAPVRELIAFSRADRNRLWRLDATHNPFPLSPAQAGLVAEVAQLAPYDMRVVGGYLYTAQRESKAPSVPAISREQLKRLFHDELLPKMEAALADVERAEAPSLADALRAYRNVFRCYTDELGPALASLGGSDEGKNPLSVWLERAQQGSIGLESLMEAVAPIAPAWDVSVPTYGETPALVQRALALTPPPFDDDATESAAHLSMEESLSESDDLLFYRAQYAVRRALLSLARRWQLGDEIFFMPLARLCASQTLDAPPDGLFEEAERARMAWQEQRAVEMPLSFINGEVVPSRLPPDAEIWRGLGTGGFVIGRVLRVATLHDLPRLAPEDKTVLVMPTVTPAHALAARGAVAVVCEYGEHLGHGAAMARELNIPCIVGCRRAWRELRDGQRVAVHGQAGLVARLANEP